MTGSSKTCQPPDIPNIPGVGAEVRTGLPWGLEIAEDGPSEGRRAWARERRRRGISSSSSDSTIRRLHRGLLGAGAGPLVRELGSRRRPDPILARGEREVEPGATPACPCCPWYQQPRATTTNMGWTVEQAEGRHSEGPSPYGSPTHHSRENSPGYYQDEDL